jgi:glycosyltransferase involved in cell wall biosynthesis
METETKPGREQAGDLNSRNDRVIKILHVTLNMHIGGAEQVIKHLVEEMDSALYPSDVVCIDDEIGDMGQDLIVQGFQVVSLGRKKNGFDFSVVSRLNRLIRDNGYDVVHCHQYSPYLYGVLAAIFTRAKVVFTEHGRFYPDFSTWKRRLINPVLQLFTYRIVAISEATKQALISYENFSRHRIIVVYNGIVDSSVREIDIASIKSEWSIPEGNFVLGTISRLQPIKNQKLMLDAFKRINEKIGHCSLLIVGDGPEKKALERRCNELGLGNSVVFTGFQSNPYQFHALIDLFLLTSFSEGTSMTLLEAMSFSKPCVVTDVGGNPEVVIDGETGFVVQGVTENGVEERLTDACLKVMQDEQKRSQFAIAARSVFERKFTVRAMLNSYEKMYL